MRAKEENDEYLGDLNVARENVVTDTEDSIPEEPGNSPALFLVITVSIIFVVLIYKILKHLSAAGLF